MEDSGKKDKIIEVKNVQKIYPLYDKPSHRLREALSVTKKNYHSDYYALDCINLDVYRGECVGIIGTNGSGKSTLLKIITGVLNPTEGEVQVHGRISALLELGTGFNPEYTGIENIYLNGTMSGFTREEMDERVDTIVEFAEIGEFVHQPVKTYSSGMFARLAFSVAINIDPEILIVDEALSVGDIFFQSKCFHKFNEFKKAGKTILFVTHDMSSIIKYCDRSLLIHHGHQIALGPSNEVVDIYKKILVNQYEEPETKEEEITGEESVGIPNEDRASDNVESEVMKVESQEDELPIIEPGIDTEVSLEASSQMTSNSSKWKDSMIVNPSNQDYGTGEAAIIDFGIFDEKNNLNSAIYKGTKMILKMRVRFEADVEDPIFAFTIKDMKGTEITGTNTFFEDRSVGRVTKGSEIVVCFEQNADLQGGNYLISLGCTKFEAGSLVVYNRLYDVCSLNVISDQNTVGYYDMNSKIYYE